MKYCKWKLYSNLRSREDFFTCIKCCTYCKKKCKLFCKSSAPCTLELTEIGYLMIKLSGLPIDEESEEV